MCSISGRNNVHTKGTDDIHKGNEKKESYRITTNITSLGQV